MRIIRLVFLGVSLCFSANLWAGLNDGLIAYFPFNGNANDESGNGYHGTEYGAVLTQDRLGNTDRAYSFNGINSYIHLHPLDSVGFSDGSVSLWFKIKTGFRTGNQSMNLFSKDNSPFEENVIELYFDGDTGRLKLDYGDFDNSIFSDRDSWDEEWYHVTFTWGNSGITMYINGLKQADALSIVSPVNTDTMTIIGSHQATVNFFNGDIDDVRIYNRVLSESEIQQLHQGDATACTDSPGNVSPNLDIHMPSLDYQSLTGTQNIWADFEFYGHSTNGELLWKLKDFGVNQ